MNTALENRLEKLEKAAVQTCPFVARILCKGAEPTQEEQLRIDEAKSQGGLVIVRRIVALKQDDKPQEQANET